MAESAEVGKTPDAQDILDALIAATKNITLPRYYYFCTEEEARAFWEGDDEKFINFALNVRPISWTRPAGAGDDSPPQYGAMQFKRDESKDNMGWFVEETYNSSLSYQDWIKDYLDDFSHLNTRHTANKKDQMDYVCVPEFAFPLPIRGERKKGAYYNGNNFEADWSNLQASRLLKESFICLGSAHREYEAATNGSPVVVNNIAYLYPDGSGSVEKISRNDILELKQRTFPSDPKNVFNITVNFDDEVGLKCGISIDDKVFRPRSKRTDLLNHRPIRDLKRENPMAYEIIASIFDFQESLEDCKSGYENGGQFLVYKQSAAKKLGEYLHRHEQSRLNVYVTKRGVIAVLICYDAYDPTIFLSAVRLQRKQSPSCIRHPQVDLFFIPSYNASTDFENMCKLLSKATNAIVVYLTSIEDRDHKDRYKIFIGGIDILSDQKWADAAEAAGEPVDTFKAKFLIEDVISGRDNLRLISISRALIRKSQKTRDTADEPNPTIIRIGDKSALE